MISTACPRIQGSKRSTVVIALALPGAIFAGLFGSLVAAFAGDADPTVFASLCWFVWGVFGGACIGALPGLIVGLFLRVRWVVPFFSAAIGALYGLAEASGIHLAQSAWKLVGGSAHVHYINIAGYASGGAVVLGFLIGLVWWHALANPSNPWPFSLRTLLIATTLVAILLGLIAAFAM